MVYQGCQSPEVVYDSGQGEGDKQVLSSPDTAKEAVTINGYHTAHYNGYGQQSPYQATPEQQQHRTKRRPWLLPGVAVLVAIVAGVIGGVTGWKVTEARQAQTCRLGAAPPDTIQRGGGGGGGGGGSSTVPPSVCPVSPNDTAGVKRTIREHSGLAVVGCQYDNEFSLKLFYQAPNDSLVFSSYTTTYGRWTAPRLMPASVPIMAGTPMAVTVFYHKLSDATAPPSPQIELYFLSPEGRIYGHNWRDFTPLGGDDGVNFQRFMASRTSSLSAMWPYVQFVNEKGELSEIWWSDSWRVFPNFTSSDLAPGTGTGAGSSDNGGVVILSQTDGSSGTKFSRPTSDPVFASADVPTSITCLTKAPGVVNNDKGNFVSVALSTNTDLNRCYFQSNGGRIKEVLWDGTKWTDLGYLPMP
ncbi:hypothetical protein MAPG_09226 [Magnaporthiopsis poae ATCC 64411]|uniref:Fucose-specific lectin n=1 Tax=Magnaporthiopsis poae (strain ATCC 64411 / 73-15) TaxID=644358 RepID=A0A0C4E9E3_MAGP6|nr:hypothetical protein MAPG_09226 [Magnaporthiopsis poae ATCC 64411]